MPAAVDVTPTVVVMVPLGLRNPSEVHPDTNSAIPKEILTVTIVVVVALDAVAPVVDALVDDDNRSIRIDYHHRR